MSLAPDLPSSGSTTLESLSDDCLLCIIDELKIYDEFRHRDFALLAFSATNRRVRQLCLSFMFKADPLIIRVSQNEREMIDHLSALEQFFARQRVLALSVHHLGDRVQPTSHTDFTTADSTAALGHKVVTALPALSSLKELRLANIKVLGNPAKAALRQVSLDLMKRLSVTSVPDAACFIRCCPNLTSFSSDYPCNKPKTTLKALSESPVNTLSLRNWRGWKPKQIEDLCQYLNHIIHLSLDGRIKVKATELVGCLQPLQNLRTLSIDPEPWFNDGYLARNPIMSMIYDPYEAAWEELGEDPAVVARGAFNTLTSLATAYVHDEEMGTNRYRPLRHADGSVQAIRHRLLFLESRVGPFGTLC